MAGVPRIRATRKLRRKGSGQEAFEFCGKKLSPKKALQILREIAPWVITPGEIAGVVHALIKAGRGTHVAEALKRVVLASHTIVDLTEQLTAHNPHLAPLVRDGTIIKEREEAIADLVLVWKELITLWNKDVK